MDVIIHLCLKFEEGLAAIEVRARTSNYIALFYVNVITYLLPNPNTDLAIFVTRRGSSPHVNSWRPLPWPLIRFPSNVIKWPKLISRYVYLHGSRL